MSLENVVCVCLQRLVLRVAWSHLVSHAAAAAVDLPSRQLGLPGPAGFPRRRTGRPSAANRLLRGVGWERGRGDVMVIGSQRCD